MRRVALLLVPALLLACDREPTFPDLVEPPTLRASSGWNEYLFEADWVYYAPCLDEYMHGTGTSLIRDQQVVTPHGVRLVQRLHELSDTWQLEGLTTGHIWLPVPGLGYTAVATEAGDFLTLEERFVFKNQTTGQVIDWPSKIHFVTNAQGEVTVDRYIFYECSLRH